MTKIPKFIWRKRKPPKNEPPANQEQQESEEKPQDKKVVIGPRVQIDFSYNLRKQHDAERYEDYTHSKGQLRWTKIAAGLVFLYTLIMGVQAFITWDSYVSVQRAFVLQEGIDSKYELERTESGEKHWWMLSVSWENSGPTPAVGAKSFFGVDEIPTGEPDELRFIGGNDPSEFRSINIPPKSRQQSGVIQKDESFFEVSPNDPFVRPLSKKKFFWGWIVYRDVFPFTSWHLTEFCSQLAGGDFDTSREKMPPVGTPAPMESFRPGYSPCKEHNCADQNCRDYPQVVKKATD